MANLIYSAIASLDGYVADEDGNFRLGRARRGSPLVRQRARAPGRHLPVRTADVRGDVSTGRPRIPRRSIAIAVSAISPRSGRRRTRSLTRRRWSRAASARTRIEREFDPEAVRRQKASAERDLSVGGPDLAAQAIKAGLVDEIHLFVTPIIVGGGTPWLPTVSALKLELPDERRFGSGVVYPQYRTST